MSVPFPNDQKVSSAELTETPLGESHIPEKQVASHQRGEDEALRFVQAEAIAIDEETNRRIRRKIDFNLLPFLCCLYMLQYLDKTTLSYAAAMGVKTDTHINNSQYSWTGSIFYFGFLAFEYPHNRLMQSLPIGKYISVCVILWGMILCCTAATKDFAGLMTVRFFLGAMEGAITAGFVLLTSQWYRASEQAFRTAIWFTSNGIAQIVGGALAYGVARGFRENSSITFPAWKAMFLLTGLVTSVYGVVLFFFLPDSPIHARWLTEEDRYLAVERLRGNQQGIGSKVFKWYQFREALLDVRTWLYFLFCITSDIPNGGVTVFFTQLIEGYGFDAETTFLVSMPGGALQLVVGLGFPYIAYRTQNRMLTGVCAMCLGLFGISLMTGLARQGPTAHRIGQLVGYYIVIGNSGSALILILSSVASNAAGHTKKTTVNAITLIGYCVGFIIGPQTFRDPPYYRAAKYDIIAQWFVALLCCLTLYLLNRRENKKRDLAAAGLPPQPAGQEFLDLTDKENLYFRYSL